MCYFVMTWFHTKNEMKSMTFVGFEFTISYTFISMKSRSTQIEDAAIQYNITNNNLNVNIINNLLYILYILFYTSRLH